VVTPVKVRTPVVPVEFAVILLNTPSVPVVLTCHCTAGAGPPSAVAVNVAVVPDATSLLAGLLVVVGGIAVLECEGYPCHVGRLKPVAPLKKYIEKLLARLLKACDCTDGAFPMNVALVRLEQTKNALLPMLTTLAGIVTLVRLLHEAKAAFPMLVTLLGIV